MALTCKQLRMVAELRHSKLPEPVKSKASEFFEFLDVDKDGKVTLQELLASTLTEKFSQHFLENLFYSLDDEEKGYLNFTQCLPVNYMCMYSTRVCGGCDYNIPHGLGYTCFRCLKDGASGTDAKAFSVCLDCYSSRNYRHAHHAMHLLHDFMLLETLLNKWPSASAQEETEPAPIKEVQQTMKQCIICGDHHESTVRGFTCDVHMARMRNSIEFVCEWCFSYLCYRCGNLYRDSTTRAEPGKWLQRFVCPACHQKNSTTDRYESSLQRIQSILPGVDLLKQCRTCQIKQKNGTLFWIVNGTNTVGSLSPAGYSSGGASGRFQIPASEDRASANRGPAMSTRGGSVNRSNDMQQSDGVPADGSVDGRRRMARGQDRGSGRAASRGDGRGAGRGDGRAAGRGDGRGAGFNQRKDGGSSSSDESRSGAGYNRGRGRGTTRTRLPSGAAVAAQVVNRVLQAGALYFESDQDGTQSEGYAPDDQDDSYGQQVEADENEGGFGVGGYNGGRGRARGRPRVRSTAASAANVINRALNLYGGSASGGLDSQNAMQGEDYTADDQDVDDSEGGSGVGGFFEAVGSVMSNFTTEE